jgi:molybdopterin-guanine dinucleotide biosynthesis protein A
MKFSAVILAGGKSSRMGRDKAFLETGGKTLLARQIETVRAVGATEVFISGRPCVDYSVFGCRVLLDRFPATGPLAGIEAALAVATNLLLLVLAVDLPDMTAEFLQRLRILCPENAGVVPRVNGNIEPLAAFYPKAAHAAAGKMLAGQKCAAKDFATGCVLAGLATFIDRPAADAGFFKNCNCLADLPCPN